VHPTKQAQRDEAAVAILRAVHKDNPYYGVARFAMALHWTDKKARRIRNLAGITAAKRSKKHRRKPGVAEVTASTNALKPYVDFKNEARPQDGQTYVRMVASGAWVQDFTHIWFMGMWVYVATVLDLKTRRIVGWSVSLHHDTELVHRAMLDALSKYPAPPILHRDQRSEYLSYRLRDLCMKLEITLSCSDKGSPWQNGFKERFYKTLKDELGPTSRFKDLAELYEGIAMTIYLLQPQTNSHRIKDEPSGLRRYALLVYRGEETGCLGLGEVDIMAHSYHSYERDANENLNGLVRRFFPKGTDFRTLSEADIARVEYLLNSRPRKRLGWKTSYEVFYELTGVALLV
jgi:transposase InsO family protein